MTPESGQSAILKFLTTDPNGIVVSYTIIFSLLALIVAAIVIKMDDSE